MRKTILIATIATLLSAPSYAGMIQIDYSSASAQHLDLGTTETGSAKLILDDATGDLYGFQFLFPSLFISALPIEGVRLTWSYDGLLPLFSNDGFGVNAEMDRYDGSGLVDGSLEVYSGQWEVFGNEDEDPLQLFLDSPHISLLAFQGLDGWGLHTAGSVSMGDYPPTSPDPSQVPEPATLALLGLGITALGWRRRQG